MTFLAKLNNIELNCVYTLMQSTLTLFSLINNEGDPAENDWGPEAVVTWIWSWIPEFELITNVLELVLGRVLAAEPCWHSSSITALTVQTEKSTCDESMPFWFSWSLSCSTSFSSLALFSCDSWRTLPYIVNKNVEISKSQWSIFFLPLFCGQLWSKEGNHL